MKLLTYLTNKDAPSSGFSIGKLKDDTGTGDGSGITVQTHNDFLYGLVAPITKYKGAVADTNESDDASDALDAHELMVGVQNENVNEYDNSTTYAQDAHVMYLGLQFVSMVGSNTGNNPIDNPEKWLPCNNRDEAMVKWRNGEDIKGGFEPLHNYRDGLYRQLYQAGKYNFGGNAGRNFQATGLHLDGTQVTGDAALIALLDVGGADEYHLLDVIAPDVLGTRTLIDSRGRVARVVDDIAGNTGDVGDEQEDQFQGFQGGTNDSLDSSGKTYYGGAGNDGFTPQTAILANSVTLVGRTIDQGAAHGLIPLDDGTNGTPRTGLETVMKNYTTGVVYVLIMVEI